MANDLPTEEYSSDKFYAKLLGLDQDGTDADVEAERRAEILRDKNE